jgi:hypothetical protein
LPTDQGDNAIEFVVRHSEMVAVVVAAGKLAKLAKGLEDLQVSRGQEDAASFSGTEQATRSCLEATRGLWRLPRSCILVGAGVGRLGDSFTL